MGHTVIQHTQIVNQEISQNDSDALLQQLVAAVNLSEAQGFAVTLQIGGVFVSGNVIGGREYYLRFSEHYISSLSLVNEQADKARERYRKMANDLYDHPKHITKTVMIHLADAQVYTLQGAPVTSVGQLWRGQLSHVESFVLGRLSVPE